MPQAAMRVVCALGDPCLPSCQANLEASLEPDVISVRSLGTRKPDTKPQPDMKQRILLSPCHGSERRETCVVLPNSKQ